MRVAGYRAGVVSVSALKAGELKRQCEEIAVSVGLAWIAVSEVSRAGENRGADGNCGRALG